MAKKKQGGFLMAVNELLGLNDDDFDLELEDLDEDEEDKEQDLNDAYAKEEEIIRSELAEALSKIEEEEREEQEAFEIKEVRNEIEAPKLEDETTEIEEAQIEIEEVPEIKEEEKEVEVMDIKKEKEEAIIDKSMVIDGNLSSDSNMTIHGVINGNVKCTGHVYIDGTVNGNVEVESLVLYNGKIKGNVVVSEAIVVKEESSIIGDVVADNLSTNSYINGKISANTVALLAKAIVDGDIFYKDLAIEAGAKLKGAVNTLDN